MKSKVLQVKDYREIDVRPLLTPFAPDEEALETELRRLTNPYIRWEEGRTAASGDQVSRPWKPTTTGRPRIR